MIIRLKWDCACGECKQVFTIQNKQGKLLYKDLIKLSDSAHITVEQKDIQAVVIKYQKYMRFFQEK